MAAVATVAAAVGSLKAASKARDSVLLAEMSRHIDRLAAIADTVDQLIGQSGTAAGRTRRELGRELVSVEDALPLCRRCASAPAEVLGPDMQRALVAEIGTALRDARQARRRYLSDHGGMAENMVGEQPGSSASVAGPDAQRTGELIAPESPRRGDR